MTDIAAWLEQLDLAKYAPIFSENEVELADLSELTEDDLKEIGLPLGPRRRVLKAARALDAGDRVPTESTGDDAADAHPRVEAERRQLTVMFCDLVGSTGLSRRLDPEDLREVMRRYQDAVAGAITRYEGYVAKFLGDGVLAYFGWPQAHEDQAQRAVRAGLDAVAAVAKLRLDDNVALQARVGIATGRVVVGDLVGEATAEAEAVTGEAPNLAARLQGVAAPSQVVIGATTRLLIGETFDLTDLGTHELKGFAEPIAAWYVIGVSAAESRVEAARTGALTQLVGREHELGLLRRAWEQSRAGIGQVVLISGEPGIGKSRLVDALGAELKAKDCTRITLGCSPYHSNSALYPVIVHLERVLGWQVQDNAEVKLATLEGALHDFSLALDEAIPIFASLLSLPLPEDRYPPLNIAPQQQKQQTLDAIVAWLLEEAERHPVLQVWEDLHWADPSTLELLTLEIEQAPTAPILNVLTYRPEFAPPWPQRTHMTPLTLNRLERAEVEALITLQAGGKALPGEVVEHIVGKTDGVPLYVEELTKTILEADFLREQDDGYHLTGPLSEIAIPATLQDSLMARLDRLPSIRDVAQLGAVLGREFTYEMVQAIASIEETTLQDGLDQLVAAELLYQRGRPPRAKYLFKHALVRDAAYQSLLKRTRQQHHGRIAQVLEERTAEIQPEILAHHYTEAGLAVPALGCWRKAGKRAVERSANAEAIIHFGNALQLVKELPEAAERDHQELAIHIALGPPLMATEGWGAPEVERTYLRARELCRDVAESSQHFTVLWGLWLFHHVRGQFRAAKNLAVEILALAERQSEPGLLLQAHHAAWTTDYHFGDFLSCRAHAELGIALYDIDEHRAHASIYGGHDVGVCCRETLATALWLLGYPDQAVQKNHDAVSLAQELSHPLSLVLALKSSAEIRQHRREPRFTQEHAEAMIAVCIEHNVAPEMLAVGTIRRGWAVVAEGRPEEGIADIQQGLTAMRATEVKRDRPYYLALLAEVYGQTGQADQGLNALAEALEQVEKTDERWWEPEVRRLMGELLLSQPAQNMAEAEECFNRAIAVAQRQSAKSLELRAAMSLARLWRDQSRAAQARDLLAPIYGWFTEGFDTPDLKDAKALLDELA